MKSIVVLSGLVDSTLKEYQKDVTFFIFKTLEELDEYVTHTPIRAETLFFTRDAIPQVNTSLNYLVNILDRVFFKVDNVIYITEPDSPELKSIDFLIKDIGMSNWEVITGALTREYVTNVINGSARDDFTNTKRKAVYRVPKKLMFESVVSRASSWKLRSIRMMMRYSKKCLMRRFLYTFLRSVEAYARCTIS